MSEPFLAEIKIIGFNFAPRGWAFCDGQILPINQNQSLYSLMGTTFGGDGRTSFGLPDLRGRSPIGIGDGTQWGERGGQESVALTEAQMPGHTHAFNIATAGATLRQNAPPSGGGVMANANIDMYRPPGGATQVFDAGSVSSEGNNQTHDNMQPYLTLSYIIALQGLFPSRN